MVELGIFESYRSVDSDGICYVRGINRIQDYNLLSYDKYFKIYISEGIIFVDKYVNKNFVGTVQCANRFGFEEITIKGN
jgi:hypothetical protein